MIISWLPFFPRNTNYNSDSKNLSWTLDPLIFHEKQILHVKKRGLVEFISRLQTCMLTAADWISFCNFLECYDPLEIPNECQVTASSQLDENSAPYNALSTDKGKCCFELLHTYSLENYISLDTSFLSIGTFSCYHGISFHGRFFFPIFLGLLLNFDIFRIIRIYASEVGPLTFSTWKFC